MVLTTFDPTSLPRQRKQCAQILIHEIYIQKMKLIKDIKLVENMKKTDCVLEDNKYMQD